MRDKLGFNSGIVFTATVLGLYQFLTPFNALSAGFIVVYCLMAIAIVILFK